MSIALITGITGQDGSLLAERLVAEGAEVHGLVRSGDAGRELLIRRVPKVILHDGDLAEPDSLRELVLRLAPDEIYNLGGISSVAQSWELPVLTAQVTGLAAVALLDAAWRLQQETGRAVRFLQASSAEIFGTAPQSPQTEQTPIRPLSPYGAAKALAHHAVGVYRARGLAASTCILFNHESVLRPEQFVTRKITRAAAAIAAGRQDHLSLGSLDVRRDWGWAPDYVEAMMLAIRHDPADDYVVATGVSHSIAEFVAAAFQRAGIPDWQQRVRLDPSFVRPTEVTEQVGDATRARTVLGWQPRVGFDEFVGLMVEHDMQAAGGE